MPQNHVNFHSINGKRLILVVDDEQINRELLGLYLSDDYELLFACDGAEALVKLEEAAKAGRPHDFVFSDFWMPNMNGIEFIKKLRADSRLRGLQVYLVTADTECQRDPASRLFDGILLKPVTHDKLVGVFAEKRGTAPNA